MSATPVAVPAPTPRLPILRLLDPRERRLAVRSGEHTSELQSH